MPASAAMSAHVEKPSMSCCNCGVPGSDAPLADGLTTGAAAARKNCTSVLSLRLSGTAAVTPAGVPGEGTPACADEKFVTRDAWLVDEHARVGAGEMCGDAGLRHGIERLVREGAGMGVHVAVGDVTVETRSLDVALGEGPGTDDEHLAPARQQRGQGRHDVRVGDAAQRAATQVDGAKVDFEEPDVDAGRPDGD